MTALLADFDSDIRTFWALLILGAISTALALRAASVKRRLFHPLAESWDQVQGRIEHCDVTYEARGKIDVHVAVIRYSYKVNGEYIAGEYSEDFFREDTAYQLIDALYPGAEVVIRCGPNDPSMSVLTEPYNAAVFRAAAKRT